MGAMDCKTYFAATAGLFAPTGRSYGKPIGGKAASVARPLFIIYYSGVIKSRGKRETRVGRFRLARLFGAGGGSLRQLFGPAPGRLPVDGSRPGR